jgi:protoheme IX farnesyltransferase
MVIERDLDARMRRTQKRPIPAGRLQPGEALLVGSLLGILGAVYLAIFVNALTAVLAALTLSVYIYVYTPLKKKTWLCTAAGAVAGALPPVMGWTAATNGAGPEAWILFGILFFWQFPHFFSLAWLYKEDYSQVGFHMLPVDPIQTREGNAAGASMLANSLLLLAVSLLPTLIHLSGRIYFFTALGLGGWMVMTSGLFLLERTVSRARRVFFASILYVPLLLAVMVLNRGR